MFFKTNIRILYTTGVSVLFVYKGGGSLDMAIILTDERSIFTQRKGRRKFTPNYPHSIATEGSTKLLSIRMNHKYPVGFHDEQFQHPNPLIYRPEGHQSA